YPAPPGVLAAGGGGPAAKVEAWNGRAITAGPGERTMVPNLAVGKRADQQVSALHVGKRGFGVGWAEHKLIPDDVVPKIRRQLGPVLEQLCAVSILLF